MPAFSEGMQEGKIVAWSHMLGAWVEKGRPLVIIEADKSELEIEASTSGFVRHYYVHSGDIVRCGGLLGVITARADEEFDPVAFEVEETTGF
ncbi:MAG: lipoyl domain-containing protein [Candidatus Binatia bacterium]|nr:lipoyl domain-containing protein [Candidatus Binatia bacterium]